MVVFRPCDLRWTAAVHFHGLGLVRLFRCSSCPVSELIEDVEVIAVVVSAALIVAVSVFLAMTMAVLLQ